VLFTVALPLSLVLWAARLDAFVSLPAYGSPLIGGVVMLLGGALVVSGVTALWVQGGGLPMSPYPPVRFVSSWVYRYLSNPMYVGAVILTAGVSLTFRSPSGLWIVSPLLAAICVAWTLGFEKDATRARFGENARPPLLHLPPASDAAVTMWDRYSAYALLFLPWLVVYEAVEFLGMPADAIGAWQSWDAALPVVPWMEAAYAAVYPFVLGVPLIAATRADLRWFMTRGWTAMAFIIPFYLLLPIVAPAKPVEGSGLIEMFMRWERAYDQPITAFPSFHVVWAALAAIIYGRRWARLSPLWWSIVAAISVSCVAVGMHAALDVIAAVLALFLIVNVERVWEWLRRGAEHLANSWYEIQVGPVRLINHGIFAALGAWVGTLVAVALAGTDQLWIIIGLSVAAIVAAALWAQLVEGSPQLLRPYGYFGGVAGVVIAALLIRAWGGDIWPALTAATIGGALTQAIGRARCLVQGCCHGSECVAWLGIRYSHPRSRVTRLSTFGDRPLHPTQVYSAGWMLLVAAVLFRLWMLGAGLQFIGGLYLILTGLGRFVEEHYRGEPQTRVWGGLRFYQWLTIGFVVAGAWVTTLGWIPAPPPSGLSSYAIIATGALGIAAGIAFGVDYPGLNRRFSRLV
jgi:prolipoprotein diacylglyceryl transferase/PAP2 superfamily protein/phospholipid methyltransferase